MIKKTNEPASAVDAECMALLAHRALADAEAARLRKYLRRVGDTPGIRALGVSRTAVMRAAGGLDVEPLTRVRILAGLDREEAAR
jgi:hypothetical protein